ncbi:MAG: 4-aminobutyrate--2-oxoglutarate transaminase [Actinobacteria bacterium]|nr:MAG: 4-aminobutyrate--2-oxoglutarate transaminase [Actinomycetota bacterium]
MEHITGGPSLPQERRVVTAIPGPKSHELDQRRKELVSAGVGVVLPAYIVAAGGGVLVDVDGNSLIDLGSGIAVTSVGNSSPRVVANVQRQVAEFTHTCFMVNPYEIYLDVAERLNRITPGDHDKRTALFNSGAEAVENAVKIARHATGRQAIVAFEHGYHGRTNLTLALTAKNMPYKQHFGPFAPEIYRVPGSYPFRDGRTGAQAAEHALTRIDRELGADNVAAVIIEPIAGEGGFIDPAPGFLPQLAQYCRDNGIVFIADEVQTGFARTGDMFACDHEGVVPDMLTMAKGMAGGLPLAAVTGRAELMDAVHPGGLGGTYGGNPTTCAAAMGALDDIEQNDLIGRAREIGAIFHARLGELAAKYPQIGNIRGRGAMIGVELVDPATNAPDSALTAALAKYTHSHGVVMLTAGTHGNVIRFLPPLTIPDHLLNEGLDVVAEALAANA